MTKLLLIIGVILCTTSVALSQRVRFNHITIKDGLSQSSITDILQDQTGFIWMGTNDGLNKYDGNGITVYNDDQSTLPKFRLSGSEISDLYQDRKGQIWIATEFDGINLFTENKGFFRVLNDSGITALQSRNIFNIQPYDEDHLMVCSDLGLDLVNIHSFEIEHLLKQSDDEDVVMDLRYASRVDDVIWLASNGSGLLAYDIKSEALTVNVPVDEDGTLSKSNADKVKTFHKDSKGRFWVGFNGAGIGLFNEESQTFDLMYSYMGTIEFKPRRVSVIFEDANETIWVGTDRGLARLDEEKQQFVYYRSDEEDEASVLDDNILSIYQDEANSLWLGTVLGASIYHPTLGKFNHIKKDKTTNMSLYTSAKVFAFEKDRDGNLWVGTDGDGIVVLDFNSDKRTIYPKELNETHNTVLSLKHAKDDRMWFGTYGGGVNVFNPADNSFGEPITTNDGLPSSTVLTIDEDIQGNLLIGTYRGLAIYDLIQDTIYSYDDQSKFKTKAGEISGLPGNTIDIQVDGSFIWLGTTNGLARLDLKTQTIQIWNNKNGLSSNEVYAICLHKKDVWIATNNGLNRLNLSDNSIKSFATRDGLASSFIYGVLIDDKENLWLSTNNGLSRFTPYANRKEGVSIRNYNEIDGLQADEFNQGAYYKDISGELFFGGLNGFNHFYPASIKDNAHAPRVVLKSFKIFDNPINLAERINEKGILELSYKDNFLEFEFAALDFVIPQKNQYSYMLEGVDEDWSKLSKRNYATYKDLKGGDYVLKIKATNNDGIWSEEIYELKIHIVPPFWETLWFYVVCILVSIIGVMLFFRWRVKKIKREKKILETKVEERTSELASKTEELGEKNKDIMDSIEYAKKIQTAILPDDKYIESNMKDMFVLYLPKDVVSGDFYWFGVRDNLKIISAVDCTGHGVPGAFMSMIGSNLLNQIVLEKGITKPGLVLEELNLGVQRALKQGTDAQETNDGMDISLCTIDETKRRLQWSGAYNPLYLLRDGEITKFKANKYPIGGAHMTLERSYTTHDIDLLEGDLLYMFSDGFVDQFGGPKGKKYMGKRFSKLLLEISDLPMKQQQKRLSDSLNQWMEGYDQVDDICVIGIRISE